MHPNLMNFGPRKAKNGSSGEPKTESKHPVRKPVTISKPSFTDVLRGSLLAAVRV
jgi:hypothetical protein